MRTTFVADAEAYEVERRTIAKLSDVYDFFSMTFGKPGEKQPPGKTDSRRRSEYSWRGSG